MEEIEKKEEDGGEVDYDKDAERDYLSEDRKDKEEEMSIFNVGDWDRDKDEEFAVPEYYQQERFSHLNDRQLAQLIQADYESILSLQDFGNKNGFPATPDGAERDDSDPRLKGRENELAWMENEETMEEAREGEGGTNVDFGLGAKYFEPSKREGQDGKYEFSDVPPTPTEYRNPGFKNRKDARKIDASELRHTNLAFLQQFVGGNGAILSRRVTGLSAKDQRKVAKLVKRARHIGLIPHVGGWRVVESGTYLLGKAKWKVDGEE